jgi:UDP-N-acetylmuramate--alanine ligase
VTGTAARHVHFVGIGGSGLSALAHVHLASGGSVSGSDAADSPRLDRLRALGARIRVGASHDYPAALAGAELVVVSSAVAADDPEIAAARALGLPVRKRSEWLPELTAGHDLLAVAGTHGKTTTSAMLALVLRDAGWEPTAVIGGEVADLGGNAVVGAGRHFVLEADEYDGAFAYLDPYLAIITNVEWEHPDQFADAAAVRAAFTAFATRVRPDGRLVVCGDDPGALAVAAARPAGAAPVVTYGFGPGLDWRAGDSRPDGSGGTLSAVTRGDTRVGTMRLRLPGAHVVADALAVLAAAHELGVPVPVTLQSLSRFSGAARRFQLVGARAPSADARRGLVEVIDDYAHHPTEIAANIAAARTRAGNRAVWVVVQPHTYSRLAALMDDFATAFTRADRVYVTDIYAARENDDLGIHGSDLAKRITRPDAVYVTTGELLGRLAADLATDAPDGATILTLGAGDITTLGPRLLASLP